MPPIASFGALKGLRILDVSQALAGPYCAQLLADHGADVIKIEGLTGDISRGLAPFAPDDTLREYGALYQCCNRNKRGIALDLKSPAGRAILFKLAESADAVIENFRVGVMERLGCGYEELRKVNPRLVYTSIRGFGDPRGGATPYTEWPAVDVVAQAMGGMMGITGPDPQTPTKVGGGPGDTVPALFAAFATMVALWEARSSGQGQYVDVAMVDAVLALCEPVANFYPYTGRIPRPSGSRLPEIVPFGTVQAKDGWAVVAIPPGRIWDDFCHCIGRPDLIDHPHFRTVQARVENQAEVYAVVEEFTTCHTKAELLHIFGGKVPFGPVFDAADIFADPHFRIREMLPEVEQPGSSKPVSVAGIPPKLTRTPGKVCRRSPLLGEHTDEVLTEAGFSVEEIAAFREAKAVR